MRKETMNSPYQCYKHILLPSARAVDQLFREVGGLLKSGPCLLLPEGQRTLSTGKPDLLLERELPASSLKDFPKVLHYLRLSLPISSRSWKKGVADLLRFISSLSQARCWVYPGLGAGVEIMLPVENIFAKDDSVSFLSCFLLSVHSKLPYNWEIKLFRRAKQSEKQGPLGRGKTLEAKWCFW